MAKKMSVAEILAAARAQKAGGASPSPTADKEVDSPPAEPAPAPTASPASEEAAPSPVAAKPATAKPAGKMSVAEIMAAARAGKAAPAAKPAVAAPAKPAVEKPAAEKPATEKAAVAKPQPAAAAVQPAAALAKDTASILSAARKDAKPGPMTKSEAAAKGVVVESAKKKIEAPPMPAKPAFARPAVAAAPANPERRTFLAALSGVMAFAFGSSLAVGFSSLAVTHLMWVLGLARFMFPNILTEPPTKFKVGFPDAFAPGQVETKYIPQFGVWIVRYEFEGQSMIYALKSVCTHLGCTPNWLEAEQKFKCPCHGSGFYKDGVNFEGPAPRPLERYAVSLADDGQLLVDKSRTFQEEMGQWKDPASYVPV